MKKLTVILLIAATALALAGCDMTAHGGGRVDLLIANGVYYEPGTVNATFALTTMCNDHKDAFMSHVVWNDPTNGVQFTARTPWTSITEMTDGQFTTCDDLAAWLGTEYPVEGSMGGGVINAQGQEVGGAQIGVLKPGEIFPPFGVDVCGGTASTVAVEAGGASWGYEAVGCLDRGNIVFQ
jgi:hypothetical protein